MLLVEGHGSGWSGQPTGIKWITAKKLAKHRGAGRKLKITRRTDPLSPATEMEIARAPSPEFDEELLKQPEDKKDCATINEINGKGEDKNDIADKEAKEDVVNHNPEPVNESTEPIDKKEVNETAKENKLSENKSNGNSNINGSVEVNGDSASETKSNNNDSNDGVVNKPDGVPTKEEKDVKQEQEEPMEQDQVEEPQPTPEPPDQDRGERLKEPLFEEVIIDGFSFCSFDNYNVLEDVCKWSAQNVGKHPDPWYKLKFRPKEKPVKVKKEKPVKELTEKQKKKLEKVSSSSNSEKGYIVSNIYFNLKQFNFCQFLFIIFV